MFSIIKSKPINISVAPEFNIPPNNKPPFYPPSMSPNSYYLEMLDIMYKNFTIREKELDKNSHLNNKSK